MSQDDDARVVALSAQSMATALISLLETKGVLTMEDVNRLFEAVLSSLEDLAPDGADTRGARVMVEAIHQAIAAKSRLRGQRRPR